MNESVVCPYICPYKNEWGYCKVEGCANPAYNTLTITSNKTLTDEELHEAVRRADNE